MTIWIDLTNSPHVNFFVPFIKKWEKEGHQIILTARDLANTIQLIEQYEWSFFEIGGHAGKRKVRKLLYFPKRVFLLWKFLRKYKVDVGISHSSFYSPIVCRLLRVPSIYLNDNEHANGNYLAFKFASINMLPEFLAFEGKKLGWERKYNLEFYPGIKEGIYLSQLNTKTIDKKNIKLRSKIFIRLEPWSAEYYKSDGDCADQIIQRLKKKYKVVVLPRNRIQTEHFKGKEFEGVYVCENPIPLGEILKECKLFIGAGGSMTRELAFLGVPSLSIYQGDLLSVDKYLISRGLMDYNSNPQLTDIEELLNKKKSNNDIIIHEKGLNAFRMIDKRLKSLVEL